MSNATQFEWYGERLIITIAAIETLNNQGAIPADSHIHAPGGLAKTLNLTKTTLTWHELTTHACKKVWKGSYWIEEIEKVVVSVARDESPSIMTSTFRGRGPAGHGRIFRPILLKATRNDTSFQLHFYFNEVIVPELVRGPGHVGELFNLLRIGTRMRWEVIEPFLKFRNRPATRPQVLAQVSFSLRLIELEIEKHNMLGSFYMPNSIFDATEQMIMDELLEQHGHVKMRINEAIAAQNFICLMNELVEARNVNIQAMELAARKYYELLVDELSEMQDEEDSVYFWEIPTIRSLVDSKRTAE